MTPEICFECGATAVREQVVPFTFEHGGAHLKIMDRQMFCDSCKNVSYRGNQATEHELAVAAAIREAEGLLSAEELRRVRSKYRLRQTDMEQMLSVGPKTWTRWERGKVPQSKAADRLIRLIAADPDVARQLMEQANIENSDATEAFSRIEADAWDAILKAVTEIAEKFVAKRFGVHEALMEHSATKALEAMRNARRTAAARAEAA